MVEKKSKMIAETQAVRATKETSIAIGKIARKLYEEFPAGHKTIGFHSASARVAIDYLMFLSHGDRVVAGSGIRMDDNLYIKVRNAKKKITKKQGKE